MRRLMAIMLLSAMLCGCRAQESYETMMDTPQQPEQAEKMVIMLNLPEEAAKQTMNTEENGSVYFCDDYVLTVQTREGGDLQKTVRETTGFLPEQLPLEQPLQVRPDQLLLHKLDNKLQNKLEKKPLNKLEKKLLKIQQKKL